jgi:hypothetical protein
MAGNAEDDEASRRRRKEFSDDTSKSGNRSSCRENDKEEIIKWEPDGQDGYIVESADGELTLVFSKFRVVLGKQIADQW